MDDSRPRPLTLALVRSWRAGSTGPSRVATRPDTVARLLGHDGSRRLLTDPPGVATIELAGVQLDLSLPGHRALWRLAVARLDPSWPWTGLGREALADDDQPERSRDRVTLDGVPNEPGAFPSAHRRTGRHPAVVTAGHRDEPGWAPAARKRGAVRDARAEPAAAGRRGVRAPGGRAERS